MANQFLLHNSDNKSNVRKPLMGMHSTTCYQAADILENKEISPVLCPVFNRDLMYIFYGKPSYKVSSKNQRDPTPLYIGALYFCAKLILFRAFL